MSHPASPPSLLFLRRAASYKFKHSLTAAWHGACASLYGAMARKRLGALTVKQYLPSYWGLAATPVRYHSRRRRGPLCVLSSSAAMPSAAATYAAAAVASAAASSLGRFSSTRDGGGGSGGPASGHVGSTDAATTAPNAADAAAPSSPPSLEGTSVPWASLGPSLDLIQQRYRIGGATFRLLAPRDVDAVMDMYIEKGLLDSDPYWTRAWPSAIALAATLMQRPELVAGKVVADLGAGLGLAGMAAAMAGAKEVVLLDREPAALQCALLSAAATGLDSDLDSDLDLDLDLEPLREAATHSTSLPAHSHSVSHDQLPQRKRGGGHVEPLPADQLPSYAALQLTPPYRHLVRPRQGHCGESEAFHSPDEDGSQVKHTRQDEPKHHHRHVQSRPASPQPPSPQPQMQHEWRVLMALARALAGGCDSQEIKNCEDCDPADPGPMSCSGRDSGRDSGAAAAAPVAYEPRCQSPSLMLRPASEIVTDETSREQPDISGSSGGSSGSSGGSSGSSAVLRAHVLDWTAPPGIERLLPPITTTLRPQLRGRSRQGIVRQRRFDVVLACDVLYEDAAVGPIAGLMPLLLEPDGGRLLLADPPNRTVRNRERFLEELRSGPMRLTVEECSLQQCEVSKLDNEMAGGLAPTAETVPVQFLVFRSSLGTDTVGLKGGGTR
ncbi:hypothetical protein Vretimale_9023 [Volvox reticuliferus]|uniref:Uncharacterized protein n=1 Tax=Volvox reticuliferus TaxID=1737510 RepID=A0A8J4LNX9_9CHLO|nr:hypothetical protein Vretifemale_14254 [Volvox reticuliferus]GIM04455.1 hypothetical protein Vretimale_9023 [Volvox reticuliferus]